MLLFNDIYDSIYFEEFFNITLVLGSIGYVLILGIELLDFLI